MQHVCQLENASSDRLLLTTMARSQLVEHEKTACVPEQCAVSALGSACPGAAWGTAPPPPAAPADQKQQVKCLTLISGASEDAMARHPRADGKHGGRPFHIHTHQLSRNVPAGCQLSRREWYMHTHLLRAEDLDEACCSEAGGGGLLPTLKALALLHGLQNCMRRGEMHWSGAGWLHLHAIGTLLYPYLAMFQLCHAHALCWRSLRHVCTCMESPPIPPPNIPPPMPLCIVPFWPPPPPALHACRQLVDA